LNSIFTFIQKNAENENSALLQTDNVLLLHWCLLLFSIRVYCLADEYRMDKMKIGRRAAN